MPRDPKLARFVVISTNQMPWGGSEELWSQAAIALAEHGHPVTVFKPEVDETHPRIRRLRQLSCRVRDLSLLPWLPRRLSVMVFQVVPLLAVLYHKVRVRLALAVLRPNLVVISQGGNFDGVLTAEVCRRMKTRYVLIAQKACDLYWPLDAPLTRFRAAYAAAVSCYFVSEQNRRLTVEQLGVDLPRANVVRNPFLVPWQRRDDWPSERDGLRLACIGRFYPSEKGQDVLIRVLAREKWRSRPLSVTFIGSGPGREALQQMSEYYRLTNVSFGGFVDDVAAIWNDHHGLILPSRCEGLPLVLVEAMMSGRVPIATDVAGHREVVDDTTGFLAPAPTEDALDEALERAWGRRQEWQAIGAAAADRIRTLVPPDPARAFAATLLRVAADASPEMEPALDAAGTNR